MRRKRLLWIAPAAIAGMVLFAFIGGEVVMRLWNWLLRDLFGFKQLTFWPALGLLVLSRILFGGFGIRGGGMNRSMFRRRIGERWERMTPKAREKFCVGVHGGPGRGWGGPGGGG